jgi:SAM-dependent methyltransferase
VTCQSYNGAPDRTLTQPRDNNTRNIRLWWEQYPMDYLGHRGRPDLSDDAAARAFFERIDREFRRAAWFAQPCDAPLFGALIDFAALRGKRVLEIGCGLGAVSAELARQQARVTALDLTWTGVSAVARRFALDRLCGAAVQGDAMHLPFADSSFDFVWSWGVLLHAPDLGGAVAEIRRVLKPGGELRLMIYNRHSIYNWLGIVGRYGVLRLQLLRHSVPELWNRYSDGRDIGGCPLVRYYSAGELRAQLHGFEVLEMYAFEQKAMLTKFVPLRQRRSIEPRIPDALMRALFRKWGMLLFCRARKQG